jgi:DNA repair exonuclease SbcCD nuclease subunit
LTWLHLSDWHQKGKDFNRQVVRDALVRDISERKTRINPDLEQVDFIIFSGDVAYRGKENEYQAAVEYLFEPILKVTDLTNDRLFIVPGNHDLNRDSFELLPETILHSLISKPAEKL